MKNGFFKYIFILFVIAIIGFTVYMIYFRPEAKTDEVKESKTEEITETKDLRLGVSNFDNINPLLTNNKEILNIDRVIFEPLMTYDSNYKLEKCLATECSKTDSKTYIVKIDNDKKWSDGSPLIAKDIQFTIDRLKEGISVYAYNVEKVVQVEVVDQETVKITLSEEVPFFEYLLTFPILPNNYYMGEDMNTSEKIPVGTGMYKIESINDNNIVLVKNPKWWNIKDKEPKIDKITIKKYSEIGELYNNFKLGNTDIFTSSNTNLEQYIGTIGYTKSEIKGRSFDYLAFNCEEDLLSNKSVRQAISYALDKPYLVSSVYGGEYYVSDFPLDYGNYLYDEKLSKQEYNEDKARKVLTDDGWVFRNSTWQKQENYRTKRLNLTITVEASNDQRIEVAENIKEQLANIGIKVTIKKVTDKQYKTILNNHSYQMIITGVYNSYTPNVNSFLETGNLQNYSNEEIDRLLSEVKNTSDENTLKEKYKRIEEIYFEDLPFIGLYRNKSYIVKSRALSGEINGNSYFSYYNLENWNRL